MQTQSIPQQTWDERQKRIAGQHSAFDLFYWLLQGGPDLVAEERANRARLATPSAYIVRLRVIASLRRLGYITEEEYQGRFAEFNRRHGKRCTRCQEGNAIVIQGDDTLCGACWEALR